MSKSDHHLVDIHGKPYNRSLLVAVLLIGTFCTVLNATLLSTAFPALMNAFSVSESDIQWLTTGFLLVNGIMIPVSAFFINKFRTKYLYLIGMITFLIGTICCFSANSFEMILTGRLIQAAGVGISMPLLQTIMLTIYPPEKRGAAMGTVGIVIGLAPALGPTLSGWIIDKYSWRELFGMIIPIVIIVIVMALFLMRDVIPLSNPSIDWLSVVESTLGFGTLLYGFSSVGKYGWASPHVYGFILVGVLIIGLFTHRQLTIDKPLLELRVFASPTFTLAAILSGLANMAMISAGMVVPLYIQNILGKDAFHSGLTLLPGAIFMGIMTPITGMIFDRMGAKRLAISGMFLLTISTLPFAFLTKDTPLIFIISLYILRLVGIAMVMMPVTTSGMNVLPDKLISHGTAVNNTFRQVSSSIGTAIMISVLTNLTTNHLPAKSLLQSQPLSYRNQAIDAVLTGYHGAFFVATVFAFIGLILAFFLKEESKVATPQANGGEK